MSDGADEHPALTMLDRYDSHAAEELRAELVGKSEAYRRTRLDDLLTQQPNYEARAFSRELATAGNREEDTRTYRYAAYRNDAAEVMTPRLTWPAGFDRATAIRVMKAAGFEPFQHPGSAHQRLEAASDAWLLGALVQLLDAKQLSASTETALIGLGYRFVNGFWAYGRASEQKPAQAKRTDAASPKTYSHRDRWKAPMPPKDEGNG